MKTETTVMKSKALFSDDGEHRLLLRREWDKNSKCAMIIMINPNTADTLCMDMTTMLVLNNLHMIEPQESTRMFSSISPPEKTGVCLLYCFMLSPVISLGAVPQIGRAHV